MRRFTVLALVALALACGPARSETFPVVHYHDVINAMAETGAKQRGAQDGHVEYDQAHARVVLVARKSAYVGWLKIRLECTFVRDGGKVRLELLSFWVGPLKQNASRFNEASEGIAKMLAVESAADRVVILKAGQPVYQQVIP